MFWETVQLSFETENLLASDNCTVQSLLDANDILEKAKEHNVSLLKFLFERNNMKELLSIICTVHNTESFDKDTYKLAYLATELFTSLCVNNLQDDFLFYEEPLIQILMNFFHSAENAPNPLLASLVCKCLSHLTLSMGQDVIEYFKKHNFMHQIIGNFDTSAIYDFVLKIFQMEASSALPTIKWFMSEGALYKLINFFEFKFSEDYHDMVSLFFDNLYCTLRIHLHNVFQNHQDITDAKNFMPSSNDSVLSNDASDEKEKFLFNSVDELLDQMEGNDFIENLLDALADEDSFASSFVPVYVVRVLLSLLNKRKCETGFPPELCELNSRSNWYHDLLFSSIQHNTSSDSNSSTDRKQVDPQTTHIKSSCERVFKLILVRLEKINKLLANPSKQVYNSMLTTAGVISPPFGRNRLAICQLLVALCSCQCPREIAMKNEASKDSKMGETQENKDPVVTNEEKLALLDGIISSGILKTLVDLFFQYPNNTFLHESIKRLFDSALLFAGFEHESEEKDAALVQRWLDSSQLISKILSANEGSDFDWSKKSSTKPGYFGHYIWMVKQLVAFQCKTENSFPFLAPEKFQLWCSMTNDNEDALNAATKFEWETEDNFGLNDPEHIISCLSDSSLDRIIRKELSGSFWGSTEHTDLVVPRCNPLAFSVFNQTDEESQQGDETGDKEEVYSDKTDPGDSSSGSSSDTEDDSGVPEVIQQQQQQHKTDSPSVDQSMSNIETAPPV